MAALLDSEQRILDGQSWAEFCDALKRAGDVVLREGTPRDAFDRAEGYRYLSRLTRVALESFIEFADPLFPVLRRPAHETVKIGADNPDNYYQSAAISGEHDYRLRGTRGSVHYLGFGSYAGGYGSAGRRGQTGYLDASQLELAPDGSFEIDPLLPRAAAKLAAHGARHVAADRPPDLPGPEAGADRGARDRAHRQRRARPRRSRRIPSTAVCRRPPPTSREPRGSSPTGRRASRSARTSFRASIPRSPPPPTATRTSSTSTATGSWRPARRC